MPKQKVAVTMEKDLIVKLDRMVSEGKYPSRSSAVEEAVIDRMIRLKRQDWLRNLQNLILLMNKPSRTKAYQEISLNGQNIKGGYLLG